MRTTHSSALRAVTGILIDRAVSMAFTKPQVICDGFIRKHAEASPITDEVQDAVDLLVTALEHGDLTDDWSLAEALIDPAGPWWSGPLVDFQKLRTHDRESAIAALRHHAPEAAQALQELAKQQGHTWLWSQPPLATPRTPTRPDITRPDLLAGLGATECQLIDLKYTKRSASSIRADPHLRAMFNRWDGHLTRNRFKVTDWYVLASRPHSGGVTLIRM